MAMVIVQIWVQMIPYMCLALVILALQAPMSEVLMTNYLNTMKRTKKGDAYKMPVFPDAGLTSEEIASHLAQGKKLPVGGKVWFRTSTY